MAKFRKIPPNVRLTGGNGFVSRVEKVTDEFLSEHDVLVIDTPQHFAKTIPAPEVFSLENKLKSGVTLKEEDSVVFHSDKLSDSEISKINDVLSDTSNEDDVDDTSEE